MYKNFERYLERQRPFKPSSIKTYIYHVKMFSTWLFESQGKMLKNANEDDIKLWFLDISNKRKSIHGIFIGLKHYYEHKANHNMVKTIEEIQSKIPRKKSTLKPLIRWSDFRKVMSKAEKTPIHVRNRALLELLWSEMHFKEILGLRECDINFEKKLITIGIKKKTYHVTQEAWYALEEYIPNHDMNNAQQLFSIDTNQLQKITKNYFSDIQTPKELMYSCIADLTSAGKTIRFVMESEKKTSEKENQIEKASIKKSLFDELVQEIKRFGARTEIQERIKKIKGEKEFQKLFEWYLFGAFPDQIIYREPRFSGWKKNESHIDFAVGKDKIPIEVKIARKDRPDPKREGIGQVVEFLEHSRNRKGILLIVDQERDPERHKHDGLEGSVYVIVI